jgi:hypothetical protein
MKGRKRNISEAIKDDDLKNYQKQPVIHVKN